jgi:hypothetical protein
MALEQHPLVEYTFEEKINPTPWPGLARLGRGAQGRADRLPSDSTTERAYSGGRRKSALAIMPADDLP